MKTKHKRLLKLAVLASILLLIPSGSKQEKKDKTQDKKAKNKQ